MQSRIVRNTDVVRLLTQLQLLHFKYDETVIRAVGTVAHVPPTNHTRLELLTRIAQALILQRLMECNCLAGTSTITDVLEAVVHLLQHSSRGSIPCSLIVYCTTFFAYEAHFPTDSELDRFIHNVTLFERDDLDYTTSAPQSVRVRNIERACPVICEQAGDTCGLCQCEILTSMSVYTLSCRHSFHATSGDCLGDGEHTILHWFSTHNTCPVCRQVVEDL
jgi:hypothetical protein